MKLEIKRGINIPLKGEPSTQIEELSQPKQISLNLTPFDQLLFKVLVKVGDRVKIGQPLVENKAVEGQYFVSPAAGTILELRRGIKRRLLDLIIQVDENESLHKLPPLDPQKSTKEELLRRLLEGGLFPHIQQRPFLKIAKPTELPRDIFVNGVETAPYTPSAHLQIEGYEPFFQTGLQVLQRLTTGSVHLIYPASLSFRPFEEAEGVIKHQISGPHPAGSLSYAIHKIAPIRSSHDSVWTLSAWDAVVIGRMFATGEYHTARIVALGGEAIASGRRKYYQTRVGIPLKSLVEGFLEKGEIRIISGDPLMGQEASLEDFLGFGDRVVSVLFENFQREKLHFFRLGREKFSATRAYLSGHRKNGKKYHFTTNQHGEERNFIDGSVYKKVMPLPVPTMMLVKAILAEDFGLAEELGILEVAPEDFALPTFICPSKIEMVDIVKQGLHRHSIEVGIH